MSSPTLERPAQRTDEREARFVRVVEDVNGQLGIVVRNDTAAGASKLTISTAGGGDGLLDVSGVMIHAPGAASVHRRSLPNEFAT